jgi:GNAT superfamily N-acetyltransferase
MIVRAASPPDAPAIAELINRASRIEDLYLFGDRTTEAEVREKMASPGGAFLLVDSGEVEGAPAGAAFVAVRGERGYVGPVAVDPGWQGRGLGKRLIAAAESYCRERGCAWLDLDVLSTRDELPPFYESLGFAVTGAAPYPKPGRLRQDAHLVVMTKRLDGTPG